MYRFGTGSRSGQAAYSSPDFVSARGKTAVFSIYRHWYDYLSRFPQTKYIRIDDGIDQTSLNIAEGAGAYLLQSVTHEVNAAATKLEFIIYVGGLDTAHHRLAIDDMNVTVDGEEEVVKFYQMSIGGLYLPYMDLDRTKELHVALKNLSLTSKPAGVDGEVVVEVAYELAS